MPTDLDRTTATGRIADLPDYVTTMWHSRQYTCEGHPCAESSRQIYCHTLGVYWDRDELRGEGEK